MAVVYIPGTVPDKSIFLPILRTGQNNRTHVDWTSPESSLNVGVSTNSNLRKQKVETIMGAIICACTKYLRLLISHLNYKRGLLDRGIDAVDC